MQNALYWKELLEQFGQFREGNTGKVRVDATRAGPRFFMILRAELVKLNNEWRLARSVCAGGWNRVPSHFDVWRQPPIMESIIARHSLSFCVPFSLAKRHGSPFSFASNSSTLLLPLVLKASKPYLCLGRVSVNEEDLFRTGRNCSVVRRVTENRFRERSDQSRLRSTRVYKDTAIIVV